LKRCVRPSHNGPMMEKRRRSAVWPLVLLTGVLLTSCRPEAPTPLPMGGGILTPLTETSDSTAGQDASEGRRVEDAVLPLVNPGENFNILELLDGNLDLEQSDEQVIVALPLDDSESPLELMIASTNPIRNQYDIVWTAPLSVRTLTGITLRAEDMSGNSRDDIVVAGFDETGRHVTEVFAVTKNGSIDDFRRVFSLAVDGNIDIVTEERSPGYWSGLNAGEPYRIVVQKKDPASENGMDVIETDWTWSASRFTYVESESRSVKAETILGERIGEVYAGGVDVYEDYLKGAWYRETGTESLESMLYFDPKAREIIFFDGSVQEIFIWGTSHRTTAQRLYTRVNNAIIPSLAERLSMSADSWDRIELKRGNGEWDSYRRLGPALQAVLDSESTLGSILETLALTGVWKSPGGGEIVFDTPRIDWSDEDGDRSGTYSFFTIGGRSVLEVQFMRPNGAVEQTETWVAEFEEDRDETRIIRSLTLTPARLTADAVRPLDGPPKRFEQIEVLSATE